MIQIHLLVLLKMRAPRAAKNRTEVANSATLFSTIIIIILLSTIIVIIIIILIIIIIILIIIIIILCLYC